MTDVLAQQRRLEATFRNAFRVGDVAEPLLSFDAELPAASALATLQPRGFAAAGLRQRGQVSGWLLTSDLVGSAGSCGDARREFVGDEVVAGDGPLSVGLTRLADRERLFVTAFGAVAGIVTWSDVQKPPVRMWLFGLITLLEAVFEGLIDAWHPDDSWRPLVSAGRRRKAEGLMAERRRLGAGEGLRLVDCLQLADKGQILLRHEETRRLLDVPSKEAGERRLRRLSRLRDSLAHSQDIVTDDWETILRFAEKLEHVVRLGGAFARPRRARRRAARGEG